MRAIRTATLGALLIALMAPTSAHALTPRLITGPYVSGWFGNWEPDSVVTALAEQGTSTVPEVNIFWWEFGGPANPLCTLQPDSSCTIDSQAPWTNAHLDRQRLILQGAGIRVLGSIVDSSAARSLSAYLATPENRLAYAAQITDWAARAKLDGVDLDWEKFAFADGKTTWTETKPRWVAFIKTLSAALHAKGLILSATVPAGAYPFLADGKPNPGTGYPVYAWDEIIDVVDRLRIMAYDYSWDVAGPLGPLNWADKVAESAIAQVATTRPVNRSKIWLGIPQYARNWVRQKSDGTYVTMGECPSNWVPSAGRTRVPGMLTQTLERVAAIASRENVTPTWDPVAGESSFRYWIDTEGSADGNPVTCRAEREVWVADTRSAEAKAAIVDRRKLAGVAVWEFGLVLEGFYSQMATKIAPPLTVSATVAKKIRKGTLAKVSGAVLRGEVTVAKATVRVSLLTPDGRTKGLSSGRTDAQGRYTISISPTVSGTLQVTASSEGQQATITHRIVVTR
jgi:hypothetical protein